MKEPMKLGKKDCVCVWGGGSGSIGREGTGNQFKQKHYIGAYI